MVLGVEQMYECLARSESRPFEAFVPNGKQRELVHLLATSGKKIVGLSAGNGLGKTTVMANIAANLIEPGRNRYFDYPYFRNPPGPRRLRIISSPRHIADDGRVQDAINEWWPREWLEHSVKGKMGYRHLIYPGNGWEVQIMSNELETNAYAGKEVGFIAFDEPSRRSIFNENKARTRTGGRMLFTLTPVTEPGAEASEVGWIFEEMIEDDQHDSIWIFGGFEDNCKTHGRPGFLNHDDLVAALPPVDDDEYEARAFGHFKFAGGLVHPAWVKHRDVILMEPYDPSIWLKPLVVPPTLYMGLDPHDSKPFAMVWLAAFVDGHVEIIHEWPDDRDYHRSPRATETLAEYIEIIDRIEQQWEPLKVRARIIDKNYGSQERVSEGRRTTIKNDLGRLSDGRLRFMPNAGGPQPWRNAKHILNHKFTPHPHTNLPSWRCWSTCTNVAFAMAHYTFLTRPGRSADVHGAFQSKPADKHKCFPNILEWFAHYDPQWVDEFEDEEQFWQPRNDYERVLGVS